MEEKYTKLQEKMKMISEIKSTLKMAETERKILQEKLYKLIRENTLKEKVTKELKKKTVDDFYEEVANIQLKNIELIDQVESITIEKKMIQNELETIKVVAKALEENIIRLEKLKMKDLEWTKEKERLNQEVETSLKAKSAMKDELDRARLEIKEMHSIRKKSKQHRKKENERGSEKMGYCVVRIGLNVRNRNENELKRMKLDIEFCCMNG